MAKAVMFKFNPKRPASKAIKLELVQGDNGDVTLEMDGEGILYFTSADGIVYFDEDEIGAVGLAIGA